MNIENSIEWLKNNPIILIISVLLVIVSSILTIVEGVSKLHAFYKKTIGYNEEQDKKLNSLNVEVDIGYFNNILGSHAIKNSREIAYKHYVPKDNKDVFDMMEIEETENYTEYFYIHKDYYVQAVTDINGKVGMYSITSRTSKYIPVIKTDIGKIIRLGKSVYSELDEIPQKIAGFLGMNRRHYNYYEVFLFDPANYRHAIFSSNPNGHFKSFGDTDWEIRDIFPKYFTVDSKNFPMHKKHAEFRKTTTINTYSVTTPWFNGIDLTDNGVNYGGSHINFGPHVDQISMIK